MIGSLLESFAFGSVVILLATATVTWILRQQSAAVLHRTWTLGLLGCLLAPLVTFVSPTWELSVLPAEFSNAKTTAAETSRSTRLVDGGATSWRPQLPARSLGNLNAVQQQVAVEAESESSELDATEVNAATLSPESSPSSSRTISFSKIIVWTWASVWILLGVRWLIQWVQVRRMLGRCQPLDDPRWQALHDEVCVLLGVRREVKLRSAPDATTPLVAGIFKPQLVLPARAVGWDDDRAKMVLVHELAHVNRNDLLTHAIGCVACAVNWFNPLVWYARRQMQTLREIACDDQVVTHCHQSADYADTLLEVARTYRPCRLTMAVAMARTSKVEDRIMAVLDSARNRADVNRRLALSLIALFGVLVCVTGSLQLKAIAQESSATTPSLAVTSTEQAQEQEEDTKSDAEKIRKMRIRVLDEKGEPLADATVARSVWEVEHTGKFPHKEYQTNNQGEVDIELPQQMRILRLWPSKQKYAGQFLNFAQGTHQNGKQIPDNYTFQLQPASRLSGVVVDANEAPIVGAKVSVSIANNGEQGLPGPNPKPKPKPNSSLAYGEDAVVTNQEGRWEILNAPGYKANVDYKFNLGITHPDFSGHRRWNEHKQEEGVPTAKLRDGTAKIVLIRGLKIRGTVRNSSGEPVTKGLVVWSDDPYLGQAPLYGSGVYEAQISEEGVYESLPLNPGNYPVTVLAPGYAPQRTNVELKTSSQTLDFQLKAGNRIELQFVDSAGDPVPNASVSIGKWRSVEAIYNHDHSNVPDSSIPRKADASGRYVWDWAPEDAVSYLIHRKGFASQEMGLVARAEPHVIEMNPQLKIYGNVTDRVTGKPIDNLSVVPVKAYRPDFYSTNFQNAIEGNNGKYELQIGNYGERASHRYWVRIEAEGYRTAFSTKSVAVGDVPLKEDFALEPAPAAIAKVIAADGKPATKFTVAVGTATTSPMFSPDSVDSGFSIAFDNEIEGEFQLPATFERRLIRVFNDDGFAEIAQAIDEPLGTIRLQPWAKLSGRLMQGEKAIANETVSFWPITNRGLTDARFQDSFHATADANGNFQFDRLPPTRGSVMAYLGPWNDSPLSSSQAIPINLKPGENKKIVLGQDGTTVVGKVVAKGRDNAGLSKQWSLNYLISRKTGMSLPPGERPFEIGPDQPLDVGVLHSDDFDNWLDTKERFFVKLADDGALKIDGVPAGEYDLVIQLYEEPVGCLVETIGEKIVPVIVSGETKESTAYDIGDMEVECRKGPRIGSDMRAFEFVDADGRQRYVDDMNGQLVLLHIWASWCDPCLQAMPNVQAAVQRHSKSPLAVVGVNIDEDASQAKELAEAGGWDWAMNYVGADSDIARQLAVSTAPAYYLIGRDGKLLMSSSKWEEVQNRLDATLAEAAAGP